MPISFSRIRNLLLLAGLFLITIGLPLSRSFMSIGLGVLAFEWLVSFQYKQRLQRFLKDPAALIFSSLYLLHLLGTLYSTDIDYALKDLRIKLPILLLPFFAVPHKGDLPVKRLLKTFIFAVFLSTALGYLQFHGVIDLGYEQGENPNLFISHIRLSLMTTFAVFCSVYFLFDHGSSNLDRALLLVFFIWGVYYLFVLATGISMIIIFLGVAASGGYLFLTRNDRRVRWAGGLSSAALIILIGGYIGYGIHEHYQVNDLPINRNQDLPRNTSQGTPYTHDTSKTRLENGNYIERFIAIPELKKEWNEKSDISFDGRDKKGNFLRSTLIRYMTSKGLKKDSAGFSKMSKKDIQRVENGIANHLYVTADPVRKRVEKILFEIDVYFRGRNPNDNSLTQRFEFWRAAFHLIREHPYLGVGTGDLKKEYAKAYESMDSPLEEENRLRAHNQFITMVVAFGPVGGLWFLIFILFPPLKQKKFRSYFYLIFFITFVASFLSEDTLETQAGVTFVAFFSSILLWGREKNNSSGSTT